MNFECPAFKEYNGWYSRIDLVSNGILITSVEGNANFKHSSIAISKVTKIGDILRVEL